MMIPSKEKLTANTWVKADWDKYIEAIESPEHEQHQGYYYNGYMRIEDMPTGADQSQIGQWLMTEFRT
jgi:hypothetical protein